MAFPLGQQVTGHRDRGEAHQVLVVIGAPDETLLTGLRTLGLAPVAEDGEVVIWGRRLTPRTDPVQQPVSNVQANGLLMTIADAALALGLGRSTVYELIGRGELEVVHVGRSARVPADALRSLIERLRAEQAGGDHRSAAAG